MTTRSVKLKTDWLFEPQGIALVILGILIFWTVMQWNLSGVVCLAIAIIFLYGFKKPIWAIAAIIASQITITSYMITTPVIAISLRLILMLIVLFILWKPLTRGDLDLGPHARKLIIPMLILIGIFVFANVINGLPFLSVFKSFRNIVVGFLFIILIPATVNHRSQLKTLCGFIFVLVLASAVIGILQHYNFGGLGQATIIPDFMAENGRVPGMGETELENAYVLPTVILTLTALYLSRGMNTSSIFYLLAPVVIMLGALYFTYTRSALMALGLGLLSIILFARTRIRWEIILAIIIAVILIIEGTNVLESTYLGGRSESGQENSTVARDILRQAGIAIALDNPVFGIGAGRFKTISPQYASSVDRELLEWEGKRYWEYTTLGNDEPHNDFINMWLTYGTPALILYILLHFFIIYNLMFSYRRSNSRFIKGLSVGLAATLVTYVINSFYHNLMATMPLLWIIGGISLATAKLAIVRVRAF